MSTYKPHKPTFEFDTEEVNANPIEPTLGVEPTPDVEKPDEDLLERIKMERSLREMTLGDPIGRIRDDLRKKGINPVSTEYVRDATEKSIKAREFFETVGKTMTEEGYIDLTQPVTNVPNFDKRVDQYISSGLAEEVKDASGRRVGIKMMNNSDLSPMIDSAYGNIKVPEAMSDVAQSDYFSELTRNVISQLPVNEKGEIEYHGVPYHWSELYEAFYPVVAERAHEALLGSNKDYYNWAFEQSMGMSYEDWYKSYADKRVSEIEKKIIELRDAVAEETAQIAEGEGREVALSSATLVPAALLGWASKEGARVEASKQFNDVLESINTFRNNDFKSGLNEGFDWVDALTLGIADLGTAYSQLQLLEKAKRGEALTNSESKVLELLQLTQEFENIKKSLGWERTLRSSVGSGLGSTLAMAPSYALGIAGTSRIGTTVKLAANIAKNAAKRSAVKQIGKNLIHNLGTGYMRGAAVSAFMPSTYTTGVKELQEQYSFNPDGTLKFTPKSKALAFMGGYIDTMNEYASEVFGSTLGEIIGYGARAFGRVTRLNKVVDAVMDPVNTGLSKAIDKGLSYLPIEDEAKLAGVRKALRGMIVPNAELDDETKELMRMWGVQDGYVAEATSEVFGDLMSQVMRDVVGAKTDYSDFKDSTYWGTQLLVAVLYGGSMNTLAHIKEGVSDYQQLVDLGKYKKDILDKIESRELRNRVLAITADGNIEDMAKKLAEIEWEKYHAADRAKVMDYIRAEMQIQVTAGRVEENGRVEDFVKEAARLSGVTYQGKGNMIIEVAADGRTYYLVDGKEADKSESSMLTCIDKETGEMKAIHSSKATTISAKYFNEVIQDVYTSRFSVSSEATRISALQSAYGQMERPTAEVARDMMKQMGITPPAEGEVITMSDGRKAKVEQDLENGSYVVRLQGEVPLLFTIPFYSIQSSNPLTAEAQKSIIEGKVGSATNKAADVSAIEVENGDITEETIAQPTQGVTSTETAEVDTQSAEAVAQTEEQIANDTLDMTNVPTDAEGNIDFDAIDDPVQYAALYEREAGSKAEAAKEVTDLRSKTLEAAAKLEEQAKNEITASAKRKKLKEAKKLRERAAFYDKVLPEFEEMEEEYTSVVKNEYSQQVAEPTLRVLDAMAKMLGLKVRFVERVNGGKANAQIRQDGYVDIAFMERNKSIAFLMGHEFTHRMQDLSPEQYAEFKQMVKDFVGEEVWNALVAQTAQAYSKQNVPFTAELIEDEVTADAAGELVESNDAFRKYLEGKKEDKTFLMKVAEFLRDMVTMLNTANDRERERQYLGLLDGVNKLIESAASAETTSNGQGERLSLIGEQGASVLAEMGKVGVKMYADYIDALDNLAIARQMEERGDSTLNIRIATGWERGADGKWRYEVEDVFPEDMEERIKDAIKQGEKGVDLTEIIGYKHPALVYSSPFKYKVVAYNDPDSTTWGYTSRDKKIIGINISAPDNKWREIFAHELQHIIQREEGFSIGTGSYSSEGAVPVARNYFDNLESGATYYWRKNKEGETIIYRDEIVEAIKKGEYLLSYNSYTKKFVNWLEEQDAEILLSTFTEALREYQQAALGEAYHRAGGEVEARNVQKRLGYTPEQRRNKLLSETADVAPEDQIHIFGINGAEMAMAQPKFSLITPEMDATYLDAVERGDMATAQRMVMEAAKLAMPNTKVVDEDGNPKVVYHQTNHSVYINRETGQNWDELDWRERMEWDERDDWDDYWEEREFNTFSRVNARTTQELDGFFFAPEYDEYHEYGNRTIKAFLNIENPASFGDYNIDSSQTNAVREERIRLQNEGYDGVINEEDGTIWEYVAFSPNQIKSADPVTYDDAGNVIPLSERFNPEKEDIRYSIMQPTNEEVTFDNFFKSTSAVFEIIPKSEVPQREPDYVSERWDGFGVSSRYWYGEDERGKYVIRESDHWSSFPQGENTRKAFETEPYNKRYTRIASCRWALAVSKEQVTTDKEAYLDGNKMYGKAYLDEFTKWEDASASAPTAETQTITTANGDMVANVNEATGQGRFSLRTYREGGRDVLADFLATRVADRALTEREASEMMQQMDDIYNLCMTMADEYEPFGKWSEAKVVEDENGNPVFSVIKANGDYAMNLDFSLVCKKRRTLDAVLNEMVKRGMIKGVSQKDTTIAKINEVIRKYGFETACALCFVDARRFQILRTARKFCDLYNEVVDMLIPKNKRYPINEFNFAGRSGVTTQEGSLETIADEELNVEKLRKIGYKVIGKTKEGKDIFAKTVLAKIARHLVEHPEDRKYLVPSDFVSTRGFDHVKQMRPLIMKLYNAKKGTGGPKAAYSDIQYLNDIIRSNWKVENAYAVGGVRLQSFSDYVPRMVFDYIQMVAELAAKELPVHAYTKEPLFAKTFGLTGIKINLSLVPDVVEGGVAAGLDADGNYVWRQGETFPYEEAIALQNAEGYRDNCGTIAVGVSDAHILKMLDDPNIRMVIPYHKSGLPKQVAKMNNVATFTDYTKIQNTTRKGRSLTKEEAAKVPNYNEFLQKLKDPRKAAAAYVAWCETKGYTPKFAKFAEHPNYYKLLEDFTTLVDNKYVPQGAVTFTFPTEESAFGSLESLIEQGLEEDAVLEGMRDARVGAIVDEVGEVLGVKPRYSVRTEGASIFYSNAQKAVLEIKQEKATPEQWLKMIEKAGGLKAGEDKWLGLSDWLKASTAKTLTKDEVLQYIAENDIQIEEVEYVEFGERLLDKACENLDKELKQIGIAALREKYPDIESYFELFDGEFVWSESYYPVDEIIDYAIDAGIIDVDRGAQPINETRSQYVTRGLDNNREIALVVPSIERYNAHDTVHFGDAGDGRAVAWIRFGETTDADGKRVLVIDEIQSKRHQDGREKGYSDKRVSQQELYDAQETAFEAVMEQERALADKYGEDEWATLATAEEMAEYERLRALDEAATNAYENYDKGVPSAPFEKNWAELAFKRMLRYAAENGYDYVAWTTGDQQAERYAIGGVISKIGKNESYNIDEQNFEVGFAGAESMLYLTTDNDGKIIHSLASEYVGRTLSEVFGKELAVKMLNAKENTAIEGEGLRIGGEGMRGFYDQMLPSFVKKYTKKWGAEVKDITMPVLEENNTMHAVNVTDSMRESVMQGQPKFSLIGEKGAAKIFEDDTYGSPAVDLEVAREMEAEGKDALSIRLATGWERGADDKWRYEIMDGEYHHPTDMSQPVRLRDVLDNPALYEAYPDLADMKVEYKPLDENRNGYYDGKGIVINSEKDQAQNASTLIHEIQHAIQHREGFAQGGNSKSFEEGLDEIEAKLTELKEDVDDLVRSSKGEHLLRRLYIATKALGKMLQINYLNAKKDVIEYDAYQRYRKLAGEVEARNVQARHAMSRHERAWTPIGETEDVARESQEFVYRTAASSSDVPRYSVRREDVDNGNIDNVIESLDTARAELERIIRDKKLTNAEKNAVMRGVKALISQELRDGLSRFTRKNDILRMMDAVNEAKAPNAMLNAVNRAMQSIYSIKYRKEFARMASLTKSKITLGVTNVDPEAFLDRLVREKKITDTEARRVIENYWKGVNASGVSIAKYVDNDTRQVMEFVNAMMDIEKAKALLSPDMKQTMSLVSPPQDIIRAVRITIENDEIADGKLSEALKDESLKQQIIDITDVLEEYWIALDLYNSISEDMTAEEVNSVMPDVIEHMANANATVEELLRSGKVKLSEERKRRKMQERFLIYNALQDMGVTKAIDGRPIEETRDQRRKVWYKAKGLAGNTIGAALGSMEYMLRKIGVNAPMGEGRIFNHFAPKLQRAYDKTFMALEECNKALDEKCKSLWGKTYAEMQKMAEKTKIGQTYHERDVYVTQAIYLLAMWKQPDARAALEKKQGMDAALADKIRQALDALDPRWREFSEWVVTEFLPSRREKYNAVHRKIFGTSLGYVPNYFPIKRAVESIHSVVDVSIPEMDALPSTIVGSIVERTKNVLPIDVETSFFEALNENLTTMEGWAEMVGIIRDFNTLLSNRTVREAMNDIAPNMYYDFKKAAQVATLSYVGKTPDIDKKMGTILNRLWAGSKIAFRLNTAFKQLSSALLFAGYSGDPKFQAILLWRYLGGVGKMPIALMNGIIEGVSHLTGHSLTNIDIMTNIEWAKANMPSFAKRWNKGVAGNELMARTTSGNTSWKQRAWYVKFDDAVRAVTKFGMKPNAFIDAFTSAAGARAVYDYTYEEMRKEGYSEEEAHTLAIINAEMAFNTTQQSSEGLYLAPMQMDRSVVATTLSTFMNAPYAMFRNTMIGLKEIFRDAKKELEEIERLEFKRAMYVAKKQVEAQVAAAVARGEYSEEEAKKRRDELFDSAKAKIIPLVKDRAYNKYVKAQTKAVVMVFLNGYVGQVAFNLMGKLAEFMFGDDDEEKKKMLYDIAVKSAWEAPVSMMPLGGHVTSMINGYSASFFPAMDELSKEISTIVKGLREEDISPEVIYAATTMCMRWGLGLSVDTVVNIALGIENMFEDGMSAEAILKVMNAPESQIRKIVGQRKEGETAKEYNERVMRFYSILDTPIYEDYFYTHGEKSGKRKNEDSPRGMFEKQMRRLKYEEAYKRDVVLRYGGGEQFAEIEETRKAYNKLKTDGYGNMHEGKREMLWDITKVINEGEFALMRTVDKNEESYYSILLQVKNLQERYIELYEQFK